MTNWIVTLTLATSRAASPAKRDAVSPAKMPAAVAAAAAGVGRVEAAIGNRAAAAPERQAERERDQNHIADEDDDDLDDLSVVPLGGDGSVDDDEGDLDAGAEGGLDKNSHRAIPSWEDAIGMIVAGNMESRSKNPKAGAPRGRGRGRGGRGTPRSR